MYVKKVSVFNKNYIYCAKITNMSKVLSEITGLSNEDCFYIVERYKNEFTYPLHKHREFELNFIQNASGVRRIIGDSVEEIGDYDLVLITGENLEHVWEQGDCKSKDIREITIQFSDTLFDSKLLSKKQFYSISKMLERARHGLAFSMDSIIKVYHLLDNIASDQNSFKQFIDCINMFYILSNCEAYELASGAFAHASEDRESRRILKIKEYINEHYSEELGLQSLADIAGMSPSSFSRFFKQRTGKTLSTYITGVRLGNAARFLVDTARNISEICYSCGFNNLSNFNRIFKAKRGMSPREFREIYKKKKVKV